ncbi:hypothetical protein LPJ61_006277, partial [Coemansia biformis]
PRTNGGGDDGAWDAETVLSRTPSPDALAYSRDHPLLLQLAQQRRTVDDLARQLELREGEISGHLRQIDELQAVVDSGNRCTQIEKQRLQRLEDLVGWYEEQLHLQREKAGRMEDAHQSALRRTEARGHQAARELWAQLATADDDSRRLAERAGALASELEAARGREEGACTASASMAAELSEARRTAARAMVAAAVLSERLGERCAYVVRLERRLALREQPPSPPPSPPPAAAMSLFAELSKATDACSRLQATPPPQPDSSPEAGRGLLYWLAVCAHMAGAMYLRLCVYPVLRLVAIVARAVLGLVAPGMLARMNVALLAPRIRAAARLSQR